MRVFGHPQAPRCTSSHGERAFARPHDEARLRDEVDNLVGVREPSPEECATKAMRDPTVAGAGVFHSTDLMFSYHFGALPGSAANPATSAIGRSTTISVSTSTGKRAPPGPALASSAGVTVSRRYVQQGGCDHEQINAAIRRRHRGFERHRPGLRARSREAGLPRLRGRAEEQGRRRAARRGGRSAGARRDRRDEEGDHRGRARDGGALCSVGADWMAW